MLLLGALLAAGACTTPPPEAGASQAQHAQCPVCKSEGDLACVDVTVRADTPRTQFRGQTYYFCSDQCRTEFMKDPERYLGD
jgi:Cu+-exporting ATPase